jgi:hypothetical protein
MKSALTAALCALALAACTEGNVQRLSIAQPRGATVAFDSIEGPPPAQFHALVQDLNDEAQTRGLAVISRDSPSAYRVRGYLAAEADKGRTTISWVWDVFDNNQVRSLRISGAETVKGAPSNGWQAADEAMLRRIAQNSMDQLAAFLTSPDAAAATASAAPEMTLASVTGSSPEAAGIYRIFRANADPAPAEPDAAAADEPGAVPMPRPRPPRTAAITDTMTVAAAPR